MNVENRKLFRNKDARARLAGMGGIIASSPELLGEVQKFSDGKEVKVNSIMGPLAETIIQQTIDGVYGIREQEKAIASALAGGYGPEFQDDTMRKALSGVFGEDIKTKAQTIEPIYSSEVNETPPIVSETPPIVSETPPVLFQPNVSPDTFSSEFMINQQAPQSMVSSLDAPSISGMPLIEPSGPAPAQMNTAADSTDPLGALINPRTGENVTLLPPETKSLEALEPRSGLRTLLDRLTIKARRDPRIATETPGFMDSDAGSVMGFSPEISPEMARELEILEQARDAQEFAGGFGQTAKKFAEAGLESANIAGGILGSGTAGLLARGVDAAGYATGAFPNVSKPLFRLSDKMDEFKKNYYGALVGQDNYFPRMYTSPEIPVSEAELLSQEAAAKQEAIAKQSLAALENADPSVFAEGAPTELTPSAKAAASVTRMSEQGMPKGLSAEAIERIQSQITADKEMDAAGQRLIAGQPREVGPVEVDPQPVDDRNLLEKGIDLVKEGIDKYKVDRASEDAAKSLEDLKTTALEFGPGDLTPEKVAEINKQIQTEKENTIIAEEVKPGDVEEAMKLTESKEKKTPPSDDPVTSTGSGDGKVKPTTTSSLYADYKKEILEALGGEKKDKNKEKWEDFSLAMFRIAAGKDPSAVANIAAGLAQSAADKKADRSIQQERDDRINMLALKMAGDEKIAKIRAGVSTDDISDAFRLQLNASRDGIIKAQPSVGTRADPNQIETAATLQAFQNILRQFGTNAVKNSPLYGSNKTMIDNAILKNQTQDAESFI